MKLKYNFALREIAGDYVLVPLGEAALAFSGMITTNEVGAFLWETLKEDVTKEQLVARVLEEFEVDQETAFHDIEEWSEQMEKIGLLENGME